MKSYKTYMFASFLGIVGNALLVLGAIILIICLLNLHINNDNKAVKEEYLRFGVRVIAIIIGIIFAHLLVYDSPSSFNFAMGSLFTMLIFSVADMIKKIKIIKNKEDLQKKESD